MPYTRRRRHRRRAPRRRVYATKAAFMPKQLALKRYGNISTKTFYFRSAGSINSDNITGITQQSWNNMGQPIAPGGFPQFPDIADSTDVANLYTEYKVLAIRVRVFAANVGSEVGSLPSGAPPLPVVAGFNRGDTVMFLDQDIKPGEQFPTAILDVMTYGSTRMIPSRISKYTRVIYRPKGHPEWGCCDRNVPLPNRTPDSWYGGIKLLGNNARPIPGVSPLWFFTVTYKILFRGRNYS